MRVHWRRSDAPHQIAGGTVLPSTAGFNLRVEARIDVKVTTQRPEPGVAELTVELPQEAIDAAIEKALKRIAARTSVAGFRRESTARTR